MKLRPLHRPASASRAGLKIWLGLFIIILLPILAVWRLSGMVDGRIVLGYLALISAASYWACFSDKRKAELQRWRTPEATLHTLELAGGWPGSYLSQRIFRHKISKGRYQFNFWVIVVIYQLVALDFVLGWRVAGSIGGLAQRGVGEWIHAPDPLAVWGSLRAGGDEGEGSDADNGQTTQADTWSPAPHGRLRDWRDSQGRVLRASFNTADTTTVTLDVPAKGAVTYPREVLSPADLIWVNDTMRRRRIDAASQPALSGR